MEIGKRTWLWVTVGCGAAALLIYLNRGERSEPLAEPAAAESSTEEGSPPTAAVEEPASLAPRAEPSIAPSVQPTTGATANSETERPPCTSDDQCKGPRHAPCIEVKCVSGKCIYDESHCECVSHEDCDDDDPCTRNHCFASTQKCIYIPIDDCKK